MHIGHGKNSAASNLNSNASNLNSGPPNFCFKASRKNKVRYRLNNIGLHAYYTRKISPAHVCFYIISRSAPRLS